MQHGANQPTELPDMRARKAMVEVLQGAWRARAVHVAVELGIPDLLADGAKTVDELAAATGSHGPSLGRLLRVLARTGIFRQLDGGKSFANNELSAVLRSDPGCAESTDAQFQAASWHWRAWGELRHSIRTGQASFEHANGLSFWELTQQDAKAGALFNAAMSSVTLEESRVVPGCYDFSHARTVVDVAGGRGSLLAELLSANPDMHGQLLERPEVAVEADRLLAERGLTGRYEIVPGDFFVEVPAGADLYLIKNALHDWEDDDVVAILTQIKRAMRPDSTLLLLEHVIEDDAVPETLFIDLLLLVLVGGRDRSVDEWNELVGRAGLRTVKVYPTPAAHLRILEVTHA